MARHCWLLALGMAIGLVQPAAAESARKRAERAIAELSAATNARERAAAIEELGKVGQIQKSLVTPVLKQIREGLDDKSVEVRRAAATAYGRCDPDPKEAVPALTKLLKDDADEGVRISAGQGLASMGPAARDALPVFRSILAEERKKQQMNNGQQTRLQRELSNSMRQISGR